MNVLEEKCSEQKVEEWILKEYDFYPTKMERDGLITKVICDRGQFALKHTKTSLEQLQLFKQCVLHLQEREFAHILPLVPSKYNESIIPFENGSFYVTPWVEDQVEEKYKNEWEKTMITTMGKLHYHSLETFSMKNRSTISRQSILKNWKSKLIEINEYKRFAKERNFMSPFESIFIQHADFINDLAVKSIKYLKDWEQKYGTENPEHQVICHNQIYRKHVLHSDHQHYFINFEQVKIDSPARDLVLFFRRHIDKALHWESTLYEWIKAYEHEYPLKWEDKLLFSILLLYPERVFKEIEVYYHATRDWNPIKQAKYLERLIQNTFQIKSFVKHLLDN